MIKKMFNLRISNRLLFVSCLFISAITQAANTIPTAPTLAAKGYVLLDFNSGQIIAEDKGDQRMEPASLTKMMTTYVISHELKAGNISLQDNQ